MTASHRRGSAVRHVQTPRRGVSTLLGDAFRRLEIGWNCPGKNHAHRAPWGLSQEDIVAIRRRNLLRGWGRKETDGVHAAGLSMLYAMRHA